MIRIVDDIEEKQRIARSILTALPEWFGIPESTENFCYLFYQPKKKLLCLSVNVRKIGVQFATCQQSGISHTAMLLEIAEMPLPPYPD